MLPARRIERTGGRLTSFDAGRGCPFQCSFCTIINVQGRKSRYRSPTTSRRSSAANLAQGIDHFFITDDNFARNKNWEPIFDRLIELREQEGCRFRFVIQVDTLCHKIPNFIEKAARAGVTRVFIGLENINPDSLIGAKKRQNRISEYREMLLAWKRVGCFTYAGYILGFPTDTPETIVRDITIIQRELPLDLLEFFFLTPLPGSEDHKRLFLSGVPMDPDMNKYDLEHVTHRASADVEGGVGAGLSARLADLLHAGTHGDGDASRRGDTDQSGKMMFLLLWFYGCVTIEKIHPLEGGYLRRKVRTDRRPGLPVESVLRFYPKYLADLVMKHLKLTRVIWRMARVRHAIKRDPHARDYMDTALTPVTDDEMDVLEMFTVTDAARAAGVKARRDASARARTEAASA